MLGDEPESATNAEAPEERSADRPGLVATSGDGDPPGGTEDATSARPPEGVRHAEDGAAAGEGRQD